MGYLDDVIKESREKKKKKSKDESEDESKDEKIEETKASKDFKKGEAKISSSEIEKIKRETKKFEEKQEEEEEEIEQEEASEVEIKGEKELIAQYGDVKIYKVEGESLPIYKIPVIKPRGPEKKIINTLKEAATQLITVSPERFRSEEKRRKFYVKRIKEIIESNPELGVPETKKDFYASMVVREMIGYGVIDPLVRDKKLEEIMVISPSKPVYVHHREYDTMKTNVQFGRDEEIRDVIDRIGRQVGRRIDRSNPLLDARLPDGSRVNATIKPISLEGSTLTIRSFRENPISLTDLITWNTITPEAGAYLWLVTEGFEVRPANVLISGGTASGKTTTLNVLSSLIPPRERIISVEQTAELNLPIEHWVKLETRPPGLEGKGEISMAALVKNSLRMRPDRMIVGEIRGEEAFSLFTAMNTGHDGSMGTVHANSAKETITRITSPPMNVPVVMANALDFIIIQKRLHHPEKGLIRRITSITEVQKVKKDGSPELRTLFKYDPTVDKLKRKRIDSLYEKEITRYLDISKEDIKREVDKRKEYLERLVKDEVIDQDELKEKLKEYKPLYKIE
ncbi:MAG: CpaF family protein [archaeon]